MQSTIISLRQADTLRIDGVVTSDGLGLVEVQADCVNVSLFGRREHLERLRSAVETALMEMSVREQERRSKRRSLEEKAKRKLLK